MARKGWFDPQSSELMFATYMEQMESWQEALADGKVDPEEVRQQGERVSTLLRALEPKLSDALHEEVTQVLFELAVFYGMQRLAELESQEEGE